MEKVIAVEINEKKVGRNSDKLHDEVDDCHSAIRKAVSITVEDTGNDM